MRVGVIRNDLSSPILAADLEQVSRRNDSVDAGGQVRYLSYPTDAALQAAMDDNGAVGVTVAALRAVTYPTPSTIDVSSASILALGAWGGLAADVQIALVADIADAVAPQFAETDVAVESFLKGNIAGFASASFNPDSRNPAVPAGAAVAVVEDDGVTDFATANTVPTVSGATYGSSNTAIVGTGLGGENGGSTDPLRSTVVKFSGALNVSLSQEEIENAGGSVTDTQVDVPDSLTNGATTNTNVEVFFRQLVSNSQVVA